MTRAAVHVLLTPWIVLPLLWGSLVVMLCTPVAAFLAIVAAAFQARRRRWAAVVALGLLSPMG